LGDELTQENQILPPNCAPPWIQVATCDLQLATCNQASLFSEKPRKKENSYFRVNYNV